MRGGYQPRHSKRAKYRTDTQQKDHGTEEDLPAFDGRVQAPALTHADVAPTQHTAPGACGRDSTFDVPDVALGHKVTRRIIYPAGRSAGRCICYPTKLSTALCPSSVTRDFHVIATTLLMYGWYIAASSYFPSACLMYTVNFPSTAMAT